MTELITSYPFKCLCGFRYNMPMLSDDPTGSVAFDIAAEHLGTCDYEGPEIDPDPDD